MLQETYVQHSRSEDSMSKHVHFQSSFLCNCSMWLRCVLHGRKTLSLAGILFLRADFFEFKTCKLAVLKLVCQPLRAAQRLCEVERQMVWVQFCWHFLLLIQTFEYSILFRPKISSKKVRLSSIQFRLLCSDGKILRARALKKNGRREKHS